jgi:hypothetical protein
MSDIVYTLYKENFYIVDFSKILKDKIKVNQEFLISKINIDIKYIKWIIINDTVVESIDELTLFNKLEYVDLSNNKLKTLPKLPKLKELVCNNNLLTLIDNIIVERLDCNNNKLTRLINTTAKSLHCSYNNIKNIKCSSVLKLYCDHNEINSLSDINVSNVLLVDCSNNKLERVEKLESCEDLFINNNFIKEMPIFSKLKRLDAQGNKFEFIPFMGSLKYLCCNNDDHIEIDKKFQITNARLDGNGDTIQLDFA